MSELNNWMHYQQSDHIKPSNTPMMSMNTEEMVLLLRENVSIFKRRLDSVARHFNGERIFK